MEGKTRPRYLVREQPHHQKAFEFYYSLGESRNYKRVAVECRVSVSTVKTWGTSFSWKRRVRERDLEIARELASRTLSDEVNHREQHLKIVHMALVRLAKAIADGSVKTAIGDLDKLIRLDSFLRDEPDSRQEIVVADLKGKSAEELKAMIREEMTILRELGTAG